MKEFHEKHVAEFGSEPDITVLVPGVSRFLGLFADYSRGFSLCAADSRRLIFCLSLRNDSQIKVYNAFVNDRKHFTTASLKFRKEDRWANYIKGVLTQLASEGHTIPGLDITLDGDILTGNSDIICSSVVVATCLAMEKLFDIKLDEGVLARMIVKACLNFSGENCCTSSVRTMLCAQEDKFVFYDNKGGYELVDNPFPGSNLALLYVESGVPTNVMKDEVERKYAEIKDLFDRSYSRLSIPILSGLADEEVRERIAKYSEEEKRLVLYLIDEFKIANLSSFADLTVGKAISRSGKAIRNTLEISFPEMEWIIKRANENPGCMGSSNVATGGSGIVCVVMKRNSIDSFLTKLEDYEHIFGFRLKVYEFKPLSGAVVYGKADEDSFDK